MTAIKTSPVAPGLVPVSPGARERQTILPPGSADARWWVIHATEMVDSGDWRIRHTDTDGAPEGREVHWSSLLMWVLAGLGCFIGALTETGPLDSIPEAALYACPLLLVLAMGGLGFMVGKRFGVRFGVLFAVAFATSFPVFESFRFAQCDHHGLVLAFAVGSVMALCCGGCGICRTRGGDPLLPTASQARRWFALSGILGGAALWVSSATFIPVLIGCALGACTVAWVGRQIPSKKAEPELWRLWGFWGCASSIFFYLLEYFPDHLGWRLEVNHPLYALAWLGAGEILYRLQRGIGQGRWNAEDIRGEARLVLAFVLGLAPVALILLNSEKCFWVRDKFLLSLHVEYIQEFQSLWNSLSGPGWLWVLVNFLIWPSVTVIGSTFLWISRAAPMARWTLVAFAFFPAMVIQVLTFAQIRWGSTASAMWVLCAILLAIVAQTPPNPSAKLPCAAKRFLLALAVLAVSAFPAQALISLADRARLGTNLPKNVAPSILIRDISHQLIQSSPTKLPVVLSGVNSSSDLSYFGGIRTLGTLYWENLAGLERAARIFAAVDPSEVRERLKAAGITHIVIASWDDFGEAYVRLLKTSGKIPETDRRPMLAGLVAGENPPDWLRPLYYPIPQIFGLEDQKVRIFAFTPDQSPVEALVHRGIYFLDAGDPERAIKVLTEARQKAPSDQQVATLLERAKAAARLPHGS